MGNFDFIEKEATEIRARQTGNKEDVEKAIMNKLEEIFDIYRAYNPEGNYLSLCIIHSEEDGAGETYFHINNDPEIDGYHYLNKTEYKAEVYDA